MSTGTLIPFPFQPNDPYQYRPLTDDHSFRLLCLRPGIGDDQIECTLVIAEFPFHQAPISYEAISYVWGDPNNKVGIICDGQTLEITAGLAVALRRVRLPTEVRFLWADGICIDQKDVQERISQVQMMALVYKRAKRVLAWIGYEDGAEVASHLIKKFRTVFEAALEAVDDLYLREVMDAQVQADLKFVVRMFEKPIFSRVWIIQEIGVASAITFLYGDFEIDWIDLVFFVNCMMRSQDLYQLEYYTDYEKFYTAFSSYRQNLHKEEELPDFLDILLMGRNYGASEPRDHVFALLGHPSAFDEDSIIIRADYTKPLSYILTQVTTRLLHQGLSLRPLSAVHHDNLDMNAEFPSWVPALHKASLVAPLGVDEGSYYDADSEITDVNMFRINSYGILTIRGLIFDTISASSTPSFPEGGAATEPRTIHAFEEAFALSQSHGQVTYETSKRLEAFGLTITAGMLEHNPAEDDVARHRANFLAYLVKVHDMQRSTRRKLVLGPDPELVTNIMNEASHGTEYHFTRDANVTWSGRKFFCTSRGFFGLGPAFLRKDDLCCVLFGAFVPFVLRKVKNHYLLVGECYLHGIMRGEAMEMWRKGELELQEFELH